MFRSRISISRGPKKLTCLKWQVETQTVNVFHPCAGHDVMVADNSARVFNERTGIYPSSSLRILLYPCFEFQLMKFPLPHYCCSRADGDPCERMNTIRQLVQHMNQMMLQH